MAETAPLRCQFSRWRNTHIYVVELPTIRVDKNSDVLLQLELEGIRNVPTQDVATVAFCDAQSTSEIHEKVTNFFYLFVFFLLSKSLSLKEVSSPLMQVMHPRKKEKL